MKVSIDVLIENRGENKELIKEHGLSLMIKTEDECILFDTGKSGSAVDNAVKLKQKFNEINHIVLSHNHQDHVGGLNKFLEQVAKGTKVYAGEHMLHEQFKNVDNQLIPMSPKLDIQAIEKTGSEVVLVQEPIRNIGDNIYLATMFKPFYKHEEHEIIFYEKFGNRMAPNTHFGELVLVLTGDKGALVIVGCAHIGINNILMTIAKRIDLPIIGVIGGSHIKDGNPERIQGTLDGFYMMNLRTIGLNHCTGDEMIHATKEVYEKQWVDMNTGDHMEIDL